MKVGKNFIQHTCFTVEGGREKSACSVSFILVLRVKIAVIQSLRKDGYEGCGFIEICNFSTFCSHLKATNSNDSNSSKIHLISVDMILQKHHTRSTEECLSLICDLFKSCLELALSLTK